MHADVGVVSRRDVSREKWVTECCGVTPEAPKTPKKCSRWTNNSSRRWLYLAQYEVVSADSKSCCVVQDVNFIGRYRMCRGAAYRLQGDGRNDDMSEFFGACAAAPACRFSLLDRIFDSQPLFFRFCETRKVSEEKEWFRKLGGRELPR